MIARICDKFSSKMKEKEQKKRNPISSLVWNVYLMNLSAIWRWQGVVWNNFNVCMHICPWCAELRRNFPPVSLSFHCMFNLSFENTLISCNKSVENTSYVKMTTKILISFIKLSAYWQTTNSELKHNCRKRNRK